MLPIHGTLKVMGNKDIISKQAIKNIAVDLATYLLKLDIEADSLELLTTEQQRIEDRRADLVARVFDRQEKMPFILHIEIQNDNDPVMSFRMLRYYSDIRLSYPEETLRQYLIYIGKPKLTMTDGLNEAYHQYHYTIIDMHDIDCKAFLEQDNPDALILAILCDFKGNPAQDVVNFITKRLHELLKDDIRRFREYMGMFEVLSENRELRQEIKEAEKMITQVEVEKLPSYELGMEKGMEKGEGIVRNLMKRFNVEQVADLTGLTVDEVNNIASKK
ncbi:MAG: hypothetical protein V3V31_00025 [Methylococcales bacterium]